MTAYPLRRSIDVDGSEIGDGHSLPDTLLLEMYRLMHVSRSFDRRALSAQRQGRLGTYAMLEGHEAVQIGTALAFDEDDFIYPAYRQHGVQIARGMPLDVILQYWRGLPNKDWDVNTYNMMSIAVPIASQIPQAVGHAYAARLRGNDIVTGTYFGDGATSETDFHSGLNFAGVWKAPTVFICANNHYAISVPYEKQTASETIAQKADAYGITGVRVDGMDVAAVYLVTKEAVARARRGEGPTLIEAVCYRFGAHATADDARLYRSAEEEASWAERDPLLRLRRHLKGRGLWDDDTHKATAEAAELAFDAALEAVEAITLPDRDDAVRHAYKAVPPLLVDQLHDIQRLAGERETTFDDSDVWQVGHDMVPTGATERWTMAESINAALHQAMEADDNSVMLGEDIGVAGGVFRITEGLQSAFGEDRVIDTPLNESGIVGTAIGMAIEGTTAIAEIQFEGFVYPAFDQIVSHLGRLRFRTRGHATAGVVVRFPSGAGIGAHEHHCDSPEAYFTHAPGLVVVCPSSPLDAKGLMAAAIESDDPVIFLEPKVLYRSGRQDVPVEHYTLPLGRARIARAGSDLTLVTYGPMVIQSLMAATAVATSGIEVEVIDLRTLYPWDVETVVDSVTRTGRLLVVQEPQRTSGVAAEIAAEIGQRCGYALEAPIRRLTGTDAPWPQFAIEHHALIDATHIEAAILETARG